MAKALDLFKRANLNISDLITPSLVGAGVGGLGMGASSYINSEDDAQGSRLSKTLKGALKGTALGGLGGAAVGAGLQLKDMYSAAPNGAQQILDQASAKGQKLDLAPHMQNHTTEGLIGKALNLPPWMSAVTGASGMMGLTRAMRMAGDQTQRNALVNADDALKAVKGAPTSTPSVTQITDQITRSKAEGGLLGEKKMSLPRRAVDMFKNTPIATQKIMENLAKNPAARASQRTSGGYPFQFGPNSIPTGLTELEAAASKIQSHNGVDAPLSSNTDLANKAISDLDHPLLSRIKRYGGGGALGAATGMAGQAALSDLCNRYLNFQYPAAQLKYWNATSAHE